MTEESEKNSTNKNKSESNGVEKVKLGADLVSEMLTLAEKLTGLMEKKNKSPADELKIRQWQAYIKLGKHLAAMVGDAAAIAEQKTDMNGEEKQEKDKVKVE